MEIKGIKQLTEAEQLRESERLKQERWLSKKLFHRIGKVIPVSSEGLNMPKSQPCPLGHGLKPRVSKTSGGANYYCKQCKSEFFIRR